MTNWLEVGKIVGAQGLKGEVRVYPDSDFPERFLQSGQRWLRYPDRPEPQPVHLLRGRYLGGKGLYVVQLEGINDRDQAEALQGCVMLVLASDRPQLEEDEFHVTDLVGLQVFHQPTGNAIGVIVSVIAAGNDLLVVEPASDLLVAGSLHDDPGAQLSIPAVIGDSFAGQLHDDPDAPLSVPAVLSHLSFDNKALIANDEGQTTKNKRPKTKNEEQRTKDKEQRTKDEQQILIPFVKEIVPVVDLERRRVEITPPAGLIPGY